jgi:hypothetical protein
VGDNYVAGYTAKHAKSAKLVSSGLKIHRERRGHREKRLCSVLSEYSVVDQLFSDSFFQNRSISIQIWEALSNKFLRRIGFSLPRSSAFICGSGFPGLFFLEEASAPGFYIYDVLNMWHSYEDGFAVRIR